MYFLVQKVSQQDIDLAGNWRSVVRVIIFIFWSLGFFKLWYIFKRKLSKYRKNPGLQHLAEEITKIFGILVKKWLWSEIAIWLPIPFSGIFQIRFWLDRRSLFGKVIRIWLSITKKWLVTTMGIRRRVPDFRGVSCLFTKTVLY